MKTVAPAVLSHRLMLTAEAEMEGMNVEKVVMRLLESAVVDSPAEVDA